MLRHHLFHEWARLGVGGITIEDLEYIREGADQHLCRLALSVTNQRKLFFGTCLERCHAFAEHLGQVVTALNLCTTDQAHQQRVALGGSDVFELGRVERPRFGSEMSDLGGWYALQKLGRFS
jgi:hypothetical protein